MGLYFRKPRPGCVGHIVCPHVGGAQLPLSPEASAGLCDQYLPVRHRLPLFFRTRKEAREELGQEELRNAYDGIHQFYDEFWLKEAAKPVESLVAALQLKGTGRVFEAGCGTGYGTVLLAERLQKKENLMAVDLSEGMLTEARERARSQGVEGIRFLIGDALEELRVSDPLDLIFSSWVLGYIPLKPFFEAAGRSLKKGGTLAFVVHKEDSPCEPIQIFGDIVLEDPTILTKRVAFDFPANMESVHRELAAAGLKAIDIQEGEVLFHYETAYEALEHLKKSGAGTAYYEAVDPDRRDFLEAKFLKKLIERHSENKEYEVIHNYIACIAQKK